MLDLVAARVKLEMAVRRRRGIMAGRLKKQGGRVRVAYYLVNGTARNVPFVGTEVPQYAAGSPNCVTS